MKIIISIWAIALIATAASTVAAEEKGLAIDGSPHHTTYHNTLTKLESPAPILGDFPQYVQPVIEETRYEAPILVNDADGDLDVRAWRFPTMPGASSKCPIA